MKVISFDPERYAKIQINSPFDFFYLQKIIKKGDLVKGRTWRRIFIQREEKRIRSKKKMVVLKINVEKCEYEKEVKKMRIMGKIVEGPKEISLGHYHTIEVSIGDALIIEKKWTDEEIKIVERAKVGIKFADRKILEEFFMHINKQDGYAVYGLDNVTFAVKCNAVAVLLFLEEKFDQLQEIINEVEKKGGELRAVAKNELGKKFYQYDIGAILRFAIA